MKQIGSVAILGTGALGGLYGSLLAAAGHDVHFLVRSDYEHIQQHGLTLESPIENLHLNPVSVFNRAADMPPVDLAIVAWKTVSNEALQTVLPSILKDDGIVLVLQNGLDSEQDAANIVGAERVLGGCCFLCSYKMGPGHIKHLEYGRILFGEYAPHLTGTITPRMEQLATVFQAAKIDMQAAESLAQVRWKKLVWNIPFNGLSVVLAASTDQLMNDPSALKLVENIMSEVQHAAAACGVSVSDNHIHRMLENTRTMKPYDSSMFLDYKAQRPIEVESIVGSPLRAAINAGYHPPKIEMLYQQLCFLNTRNLQA